MSDNTEDAIEEQPEPEVRADVDRPVGPAYRVLFLKFDDQGVPGPWLRPHTLSAKVYDRKTAIKYAAYEAQKQGESLFETAVAVVSPVGRCIAVLGRTGKPVRPLVALRTKRALLTLMPGEVKTRRRTSRPLIRSRRAAPPRKRRMTGRGR